MTTVIELWNRWKPYHEQLGDINSRLADYHTFLDDLNNGWVDSSKIGELKKIEKESQQTFEISRVYRQVAKQRPKRGARLEQINDEFNLPPSERSVNPTEVFHQLLAEDKTAIEAITSLEDKLYSAKQNLNSRLVSEFDSAHSALETIAEGSDIDLVKQKRAALDDVFLMYVNLNGSKQPRKIRRYTRFYGERPVIARDLKKLKETYKAGKWQQRDVIVLNSFVDSIENIAKRFRGIKYYEGSAEARKLQGEIYKKIKELQTPKVLQPQPATPPPQPTYRPRPQPVAKPESQIVYSGNGYFALPIHLLSMAYPDNDDYLKVRETLLGHRKEKDLVDKISAAADYIANLEPSGKPEDIEFMKQVGYGIRESILRGDLAYRLKSPEERVMVRDALEKISNYIRQCEGMQIKILDTQYLLSQQALV